MSPNNCSLALDEESREGQDCEIQVPELNLLVGKALKCRMESFLQMLPAEDRFSAEQITGRITVSF